jgi:phenylacetate-CoA ligase
MFTRSLQTLRSLNRNQYLPGDALEELRTRSLRAVVQHAYENVPYYSRLFRNAGISPSDISRVEDIARIPITSKKDLQSLEDVDRLAKGIQPSQCVVKHTSGSTGYPLRFLFSEWERDFQTLLNLRILMACGYRLTDTTAYIINPGRFAKRWHWFQYLGILKRYYLSVFDTSPVHAEALGRIRPDILYGYPSSLTLLAAHIQNAGSRIIRPKAVFSSAEALEKGPRQLISSALNAPVFDILGLVETGDIAWECPAHRGYHINSDAVLLEFVDEYGKPVQAGKRGRMLCTSLYAYTMPLIRYDAGDICVPSDQMCECGRTLPLISSIEGRSNDFIALPDGTTIASCFLVILMQDAHDVAQYRVIQNTESELLVQLVKGKGFSAETPEKIKQKIGQITKGSLKINIDLLEELPRDGSGKIRTVTSKVAPRFDSLQPVKSGPAAYSNGQPAPRFREGMQ